MVLTDIYAAGEAPIPGVTIEAVAEAVRARRSRPVHVVKTARRRCPTPSRRLARRGDLVITLGAGSIGTLPDRVVEALA